MSVRRATLGQATQGGKSQLTARLPQTFHSRLYIYIYICTARHTLLMITRMPQASLS